MICFLPQVLPEAAIYILVDFAAIRASMVQAVSAGHAGHDQPPKHRGSLGVKATETASGRRATGRQRQDGAVLRVVRAVTGAQVKPLLLSQSSLPAVGQEAHTESSQGLSRTRSVVTAADVSAEADAAAAEHTAMLNMLRARWQASKQDTLWTRAHK
jgi:hypothetical protein